MKPRLPIKVLFLEDGDEWILDNEIEIATSLEWFDSDSPDENAIVTDADGRLVRVKVEKLEIITLELNMQEPLIE